MSTRAQRDKEKKQQEEFQAILRRLLLEEDNKYCADCDAKGPRWASWNIGVFLCIRCAGIHRNLGVHISKVKSVNLDTWTEKQITSIEGLGNRTCRKVYEAHLPSSFRRPQTDSALEHFIRAKYEQKKYIDRELEKQLLTLPKKEIPRSEPEKKKKTAQEKPVTLQKLAKVPTSSTSRPSPTKTQPAPINASAFQQGKPAAATNSVPTTPPKTNSSMDDLLGLDTPKVTNNNDLFGMPINQQAPSSVAPQMSSSPQMVASSSAPSLSSPSQQPATNGIANDIDLFGQETSSSTSGKTSKESILALFGNQPAQHQQQMYNVPGGMYIPSQQPNQQAQIGNSFNQPQMMMSQQQPQAGYQHQGMMGMPSGQQGMMGMNMGYNGVNAMQQQQAYLQQFQIEQFQGSGQFTQQPKTTLLDSSQRQQSPPATNMSAAQPQATNGMHMQQSFMHMQQQHHYQQQQPKPSDTNPLLWQQQPQNLQPIQQNQNIFMPNTFTAAMATNSSSMNVPQYSPQQQQPVTGRIESLYSHMQQPQPQPDIHQVQAQMQNMRVGGNSGMNPQMAMNGQIPRDLPQQQQQQQQQQSAQMWNGGMFPTMQQAQSVPVQGNMGWSGNMAGQTLSTQLWK